MPTPRGYTELDSSSGADIEQVNVPLNEIDADIGGVEDALNDAVTELEYAYSDWKPWRDVGATYGDNISAAVVLPTRNYFSVFVGAGAVAAAYALPWDPSEVLAGSRTTQLRLVTSIIPNGVAPGAAFTIALYQPTFTKPAAADQPAYISALGSAVTGSSKASSTLSTTDAVTVTGDPFTAPSAGLFAVAVTLSGATAVNSETTLITRLQYRQT